MTSSLTTSRRKPSPHARDTFAACWHPEEAVVSLAGAVLAPEESPAWCRQCGSLYRDLATGWQRPLSPQEPPVSVPSVLDIPAQPWREGEYDKAIAPWNQVEALGAFICEHGSSLGGCAGQRCWELRKLFYEAVHGPHITYTPPMAPHIAALIAANQGIFLDVGCSDHKSAGSIGMDIRAVEGVDIVHDLEVFPWPLPDGCAKRILCSHLIEHIKPWLTVQFLDECWRVMQENGQLMIATPYAGSPRFWQDPTHIHGWMEATPLYFTPGHPLYDVYRPKPWKLELNEWASVGDLNIIMSKITIEEK